MSWFGTSAKNRGDPPPFCAKKFSDAKTKQTLPVSISIGHRYVRKFGDRHTQKDNEKNWDSLKKENHKIKISPY